MTIMRLEGKKGISKLRFILMSNKFGAKNQYKNHAYFQVTNEAIKTEEIHTFRLCQKIQHSLKN